MLLWYVGLASWILMSFLQTICIDFLNEENGGNNLKNNTKLGWIWKQEKIITFFVRINSEWVHYKLWFLGSKTLKQ